ncbi:hypothetical protein BVG16_21650 [Paenibacillus selenitireducens]|uniref:NADP-dependent oxidoreductase domain-containing protein n=2 Tax=Paenibacillus selenitireducens TaxID=1324314 RepID=A0A1T2X666_9BACL|nr:hypothetical protein BVG16_21650 [Paenibacillus selenitireducens]
MLYRQLGKTGVKIPVMGQGTWKFGENEQTEKEEIEALRYGIANGMTLIDTAEEYANGRSERLVAQAIDGVRNEVFLVTKVSSKNCSFDGVIWAVEASLNRLNTNYIDLYLQHWPSQQYELAETMEAMVKLVKEGLIKYVGVSNFSIELMQEAQKCLGSIPLVCNQVGYHLNDRRIEDHLLPYCNENGITVMGYSPFGYAPQVFGMPGFPVSGTEERNLLDELGIKYEKTAYQIALNWVLRQENIVTIPKAVNMKHMENNLHALGWVIDKEDLDLIDRYFPK